LWCFKWAGPADLDPKAKPAILIFPLLLLFNFGGTCWGPRPLLNAKRRPKVDQKMTKGKEDPPKSPGATQERSILRFRALWRHYMLISSPNKGPQRMPNSAPFVCFSASFHFVLAHFWRFCLVLPCRRTGKPISTDFYDFSDLLFF
jgi:hypothetical protein